ncbi:hypothetical protein ACXN5S_01925 [Pseudoroseicyclus sp. H15]
MLWQRHGTLFTPPGQGEWQSHAQTPTPLALGPRHWRVWLGGRNSQNQSRIFHIDLDPETMEVLEVNDTPLVPLGPPGSFDSAGQSATSVLRVGGETRLYYIGMHLRRDVPYGMAIGLLRSAGDGWQRSPAPLIGLGPQEAYFASAPYLEEAPGGYAGWYLSATGWIEAEGGFDPCYGLRRVTSADGLTLQPLDDGIWPGPEGGGFTRPWIFRAAGTRWLCFSGRAARGFRGGAGGYRLMLAPLHDDGSAGEPAPLRFANPPGPGDWDSDMQEYAAILPYGDRLIMLYCGNGFGQTGLGWASLEF